MKKVPAKRRTQEQRRESTRRRLIDATLHCLERYGYAETTVSVIVAEARVSRGALLHHYASKNELILDAAKTLMEHVFEKLHSLLTIEKPSGRVDELVDRIWREFFTSGTHVVYMELLVTSRRDKELAALLKSLAPTLEEKIRTSFDQRFVSTQNAAVDLHDIFLMTRWLLRGMAIDAHLLADPRKIKRYLELWAGLIASQLHSMNT